MIKRSKSGHGKYYSTKLQRDVYQVIGMRSINYGVLDLVTGEQIAPLCFAYHADVVKWIKGREEYV